MNKVILGVCLGLVVSNFAYAEEPVKAAPIKAEAVKATPMPAATPEIVKVDKTKSLENSYRREFALMQTQKNELLQRLQSYKAKSASEENAIMQKVAALEQSNITSAAKEDSLRDELVKAEHGSEAVIDNSELLEMTYAQANTSLAGYERSLENKPEFTSATPEQKLTLLFQQGAELIDELARVKKRESNFFLTNGTETKGTVVAVGNIAAYGVSETGSGILVPAGDGRLKLRSEPAADVAKQIAEDQTVPSQKIFIFENRVKAIDEKKEKTFFQEVEEGGEIAWIIVSLGFIAIFLITGRILSLFFAIRGKAEVIKKVFYLLQQNKQKEALALSEKSKGPFARVLAAIIRNTSSNPEHMDDVIEEALLHESGALNRFGAAIVVIASVAPLVGLLGTVTGMIATFGLITEHGTGDPRLLSSGISIALVTTELGLVVAIPAGLAGSLLGSWAEGIKSSLEEIALRASNILLDREHSPSMTPPTQVTEEHKDVILSLS